jgi:nitroreductase
MLAVTALESRHTYRAYDPTFTIPHDQLDEIIRLALISPSGTNRQGIDLITVVNRQRIDELSNIVIAGWPDSIRQPRTDRVTPLGVKHPQLRRIRADFPHPK